MLTKALDSGGDGAWQRPGLAVPGWALRLAMRIQYCTAVGAVTVAGVLVNGGSGLGGRGRHPATCSVDVGWLLAWLFCDAPQQFAVQVWAAARPSPSCGEAAAHGLCLAPSALQSTRARGLSVHDAVTLHAS